MASSDTGHDNPLDFNSLSPADRMKLRSAAMLVSISGIAKGDTEHRAWKFPLYLLFMAYLMAPIPIPGSNLLPMALAFGWVRLGLTNRARWAQGEISRQFNHAALVDDYRDCIDPDPEKPGAFRVKTLALAVKAHQTAYQDIMAARRIFTGRIRNFFKPEM